jgi:hypothetical protein
MKVLVCGDRDWRDYGLVLGVLRHLVSVDPSLEIIEGEANGADSAGRVAGIRLGLVVHKFPADWGRFGRRAGFLRNSQMLNEGHPDLVIGFHDSIERSKGTRMMLDLASKAGVPTILYTHANYTGAKPKPERDWSPTLQERVAELDIHRQFHRDWVPRWGGLVDMYLD